MTQATDTEEQIVSDWNNNKKSPIVDLLIKEGLTGEAIHIGKKQFPPTNEWKKYNKQKSYAKTDIKIDHYKISLKSANDSILMSAKKNEALATFMCVANEVYDNKIPSILDELSDDMEKMVTKAVSPVSLVQAKKAGGYDMKVIQNNHSQILEKIEEVFDDPVFLSFFLREVLSGKMKFGDESDGSATHILHLSTTPIIHSLDDMSFINKLAGQMDIRIDFKSVKKHQGPERGMYRYWSVMQLINKEQIPENVMMYESILTKIYTGLRNIMSYIKKDITSWSDLFEFLEVEPEITITFSE